MEKLFQQFNFKNNEIVFTYPNCDIFGCFSIFANIYLFDYEKGFVVRNWLGVRIEEESPWNFAVFNEDYYSQLDEGDVLKVVRERYDMYSIYCNEERYCGVSKGTFMKINNLTETVSFSTIFEISKALRKIIYDYAKSTNNKKLLNLLETNPFWSLKKAETAEEALNLVSEGKYNYSL